MPIPTYLCHFNLEIDNSFMSECHQFTGPLTMDGSLNGLGLTGTEVERNGNLSIQFNSAPMVAQGVNIHGLTLTQFNELLTRIPNRDTNPWRRLNHVA